MPIYNVERYVERSISSVLNQTFKDFELILVDDGGSDGSMEICRRITDPRIRIFSQANRGLAGPAMPGFALPRETTLPCSIPMTCGTRRNWNATSPICRTARILACSYSGSAMIDENDRPIGVSMRPRLHNIDRAHVFCRNPIGNGSAPVFGARCWMPWLSQVRTVSGRVGISTKPSVMAKTLNAGCGMACQTTWRFEGIPGDLTLYRIVSGGLSANTEKMYEHWQRMYDKVVRMAPDLAADHGHRARGYQLRYYARRVCVNARVVLPYALSWPQ